MNGGGGNIGCRGRQGLVVGGEVVEEGSGEMGVVEEAVEVGADDPAAAGGAAVGVGAAGAVEGEERLAGAGGLAEVDLVAGQLGGLGAGEQAAGGEEAGAGLAGGLLAVEDGFER